MDKQSISTSMTPELVVEQILGDLTIKGWEEAQVIIQADPDELTIDQQEDTIYLSCQGDCSIRLPHGTSIKIDAVHGDAHFKYLQDNLVLGEVHGSLTLRTVGATQIDTVHGDFSAKEIDGPLSATAIFGNAAGRDILGNCTLEDVHGNLDLRHIEGQVKANASGNVRLRLDMLAGISYQVQAEGNLHCNIPQATDLKLDLSSDAEIIKVKLPDSAQVYRQPHLLLNLGEANIEMVLSAGGGLYLSCDENGYSENYGETGVWSEDFSQQIAQQVETQISTHLEQMSQQLNEQMERMSNQFSRVGMTPDQVNKILDQARQVSERETTRAQEKMRRAQEKLERKLEASRRRHEVKTQTAEARSQAHAKRSGGVEWPSMPSESEGIKSDRATEEERLMILRMLEQKKISLDEADSLLSALEGKE